MSLTMTPPTANGGLPTGVPAIGALVPPVSPPMATLAPPAVTQSNGATDREEPPNSAHRRQLEGWATERNIAEDPNLAEELERLAVRVKRDYDIDELTRADWKEKYRKWLDFALQITEKKTYPWPDACYSLDTDVLTDGGWKPVADVAVGERVLSRGPDGRADFHSVTERFRYTAISMVHFEGKSIDLMVTPNHNMLVESKFGKRKKQHMIEASRFLDEKLAFRYIPLTAEWRGEDAKKIHGIDAKAYARFLGWYIAEGSRFTGRNTHTLKSGVVRDYGLSSSSFAIAQSPTANREKFDRLKLDIEACGFTCRATVSGYIVHARSMPQAVKDELASLGLSNTKHIPPHILGLSAGILKALLGGLMAGDGCIRVREGKQDSYSYFTVSLRLAGQIQELCQKIGWRGTVAERAASVGGVINGRQILGSQIGYNIQINQKRRVQVAKLKRELIRGPCEVACVTVEPHHTLYVRRNGKALWCGNSNVIYPLITVAAIQFHARAYPAIIRDRDVVKGTVIGQDNGTPATDQAGKPIIGPTGPFWRIQPGAKQVRADLIGRHMSWQLLMEQEEWEPQTDRLLVVLPIVGCMFRKSYFDPGLGRNVSETVTALDLCVNYKAKSFETAPRHTELIQLYPHQIEENIRSGTFLEDEYGHDMDGSSQDDDDAPTTFLEQHRRYDLDGDGYAEPYIVTIARDSGRLARIRAGYEVQGIEWLADGRVKRIEKVAYYTKYGFIPSPDSQVYDLGFGHLLFPINEAVNTTLNQMFDAGHLQIAGGGFIGGGLSINTGALRFAMGEYKPVNVLGGNIRDQVFPLEFPGPNPTLLQLLMFLIEAGERIGSVKDVMVGDMPGDNTSGITTLAVIEQGLKVFSAIYKRVHRSLGYEFRKLYRLNSIYLPLKVGFGRSDEWAEIKRDDYLQGAGVEPISDPQMVTDMQRMGRAQFMLGFKDDPACNGQKIRLEAFKAAMIPQPEQYLLPNPQPPPQFALKSRELDIRQAREMYDLHLRAIHDKAMMIREIAQAELFLSQARKLDNDAQLDWVEQHLEGLRLQVDTFTAISDAAAGAAPDAGAGAAGPGPSGGVNA